MMLPAFPGRVEKGALQDRDLGDEDRGDLRVFWGSEFFRLEYLEHLVSSGRVKVDSPERGA